MSADNGIYILKTKDQYRVAHLKAIDNVYWSVIDGNWDTREKARGRYVPTRVLEMWGPCKYTRSKEVAFRIARRMAGRLQTCEYGIRVMVYNKTWKHIVEDAEEYAKKEMEYLHKNEKSGLWMWKLETLQEIANGKFNP